MNPYQFPFGIPINPQIFQMSGGSNHQHREDCVPPRVRMAMEFYGVTIDKLRPRAYVSDHQVHEVPGLDLQPEEKKALWSAMHTLAQYFSGTLEKTEWDRAVELEKLAHLKIPCPSCKVVKKDDCGVCGGEGLVYTLRAV